MVKENGSDADNRENSDSSSETSVESPLDNTLEDPTYEGED